MQPKPDPVIGMEVTWINPKNVSTPVRYILRGYIEDHGRKDLKIRSIENGPGDKCVVTLYKNGSTLRESWDFSKGPKPKEWLGDEERFIWFYLQPIKTA